MDNYVDLLSQIDIASGKFVQLISLFFLFLGRMGPIFLLCPFFGAKILPHPTKVAMIICFFIIFLPKLLAVTTMELKFNPLLIFLLMKEIFIGLMIGFFMSLPFFMAQNAGIFTDHQRGGASLMVNDPTIQNQSSPIGTFYNMLFIFLFYVFDGHIMFIELLVKSFEVAPSDKFFHPAFFHPESTFWETALPVFNLVMKLSIQMASPVLITLLMTDVFLGIANRLAPQVQITFLGMPLKSLIALTTMVAVGLRLFTTKHLWYEGLGWLKYIEELILHFKV